MPPPAGPSARTRLRVTVDATPLLGVRTGIGRYVQHLLAELAEMDDLDVTATAFTLRGWAALASALPTGVRAVGRPTPARLVRKLWTRFDVPRVEWMGVHTDVVHGTNFFLPPAGRAAGVITVHDLTFADFADTLHQNSTDLALLVPRALRRARAVTTLAAATATEISHRFGVPADRIVVASPGVDRSWFDPPPLDGAQRAALGLPASYFLFVGTREPRKGLDTLLAAYSVFRNGWLDGETGIPNLVLVGASGWGRTGLDVPPAGVVVLDYVEQAVLPAIAGGAIALVLPSVHEGFGMPAIEGLAAGCPVIVSDIPVLREVTGGAAATFPVGEPVALAECLWAAFNGDTPPPEVRREQASRYTWRQCAENTARAYRLAVDRDRVG